MAEQFSVDDQITYLEAYSHMLKSQQDMLDVQIKLLKSGKDMQEYLNKCNPFFNMYAFNPFIPKK